MTTVNIGKIRQVWKGDYSAGTTYTYLDFVKYGSNLWLCLQESTGNTPAENSYWTALSVNGLTSIVEDTTPQLGGNLDGQDYIISKAILKDTGMTFLDKGNSSTTTQTLDYTAGSHQKITATGNFTIALSNFPPTGNLGELLLELVNGGAYTITLPTVNWIKPDGSTTTTWADYLTANTGRTALQTSGTDFILLFSRDGGTNVYGRLI